MVKDKHKFFTVLVGVVFFVSVMAFLLIRSSMNTKTFDDFIGKTYPDISKITMMDGGTGRSVSTTDKVKIKELVTILSSTQYRRASNQEGRCGFSYSYNFYVGNKLVMGMWDAGNMANVYDTYYETTIEPRDGIENWYKSLVTATTVAKDFSNKLYAVSSVKIDEYKEFIAAISSAGALDIIGAEGINKADKIAYANYLKSINTFDRHIHALMTEEAYVSCLVNRYNTLTSEICAKDNYTVRITDIILDKNLYDDKEDKAGYNYEVKLKFISNDGKVARNKDDTTKGYIGLSKINNQWKVSDYKLTVEPKLYLEMFMKTHKK